MDGLKDAEEYNASKIIVLEGPQGIRKRPAMYIGSTGSYGVLHLLYEAFDNAVDEGIAGYCKNITVHLTSTDTGDVAEVTDDGRGIPVDIMPKQNKPALEVIMTSLHSGGKFNNDAYKTSGGLHGVGLTVINALSENTEVTVKKNGFLYKQTFSKGAVTSELERIGETTEHGTTIKFKPDPEIFNVCSFESSSIKDRMKYTSFLNKGLRLKFIDDRFGTHEEVDYYSDKGIIDYLEYLNREKTTITEKMYMKKEVEGTIVEIALQYNATYDERLSSFVNNIQTMEGGAHVIGFHSALTRAILNYTGKGRNDKKDIKPTGEDVREGLTVIINILMQNPEFEGQTKEKLGSTKIKSIVETAAYAWLSRYLEEHPSDARAIWDKVTNAAMARESARKAKELVRRKNAFETTILPGKLSDCTEEDPERAEMFLVEGQSAGGSSKQARDKKYQAILPLRGKILNVEKANDDKIFQNEEIRNMITAIGAGVRESFDPDKVRYKKIIIMSDADVDGSHIATLILTFFYRFMKKAIERGYIYVALPPLYKVTKGKEIRYAYNDAELENLIKELGNKVGIQRYKGLGEMNPEQLWETTMDPARRVLKRVNIKDAERVEKLFVVLMGVNVADRKRFLEEHSHEVKFLDI